MRRRRSPVPMQVYIPVNSSICIRTLLRKCIHRVRAGKELTESCQRLKKASESALEVRRCTTKFYHLAHMRRRRSPVPMQDYIPVEQFYMHRRSSAFIVWELKVLTEYSSCCKKGSESALEVRRVPLLSTLRRRSLWCKFTTLLSAQLSHDEFYTCTMFLCKEITVHCKCKLHWNRWSPSAHVKRW